MAMATKPLDYLIIGAGPAGVQLGYHLQQKKCHYLIVDRADCAGSFFQKFPRHGKLISINKVHTGSDDSETNLRWDWNSLLCDDENFRFSQFSQEYFPPSSALVEYLQHYVNHFHLNVRHHFAVKKVSKDNHFIVESESGEKIIANVLIIATGLSQGYLPNIDGIEHAVTYADMSLDKKAYTNKRVLIIGKGNSGFETADYLIDTASLIHMASPTAIKMAWKSHYVGNLRAVNNNFLDTYQFKTQNALINADIVKIEKKDNHYSVNFAYKMANNERQKIEYDVVLACTGFKFDSNIFDQSCQPALSIDDRFPAQTAFYQSKNINDLYFAGVLMHELDFKKKQSGFIHGFRYNVKFLADYLQQKYDYQPYYQTSIKADAAMMTEKVIARLKTTSALWQQTGYLSDVFAYCENKKTFDYYEALPLKFIQSDLFGHQHYFSLTLDYNQHIFDAADNVFAIDRVHKDDYENAHLSAFLHPIIRHFCDDQLISEHHVIEAFDNAWDKPAHIKPLQAYFNQALTNANYISI